MVMEVGKWKMGLERTQRNGTKRGYSMEMTACHASVSSIGAPSSGPRIRIRYGSNCLFPFY